jgi:hypothetical protein
MAPVGRGRSGPGPAPVALCQPKMASCDVSVSIQPQSSPPGRRIHGASLGTRPTTVEGSTPQPIKSVGTNVSSPPNFVAVSLHLVDELGRGGRCRGRWAEPDERWDRRVSAATPASAAAGIGARGVDVVTACTPSVSASLCRPTRCSCYRRRAGSYVQSGRGSYWHHRCTPGVRLAQQMWTRPPVLRGSSRRSPARCCARRRSGSSWHHRCTTGVRLPQQMWTRPPVLRGSSRRSPGRCCARRRSGSCWHHRCTTGVRSAQQMWTRPRSWTTRVPARWSTSSALPCWSARWLQSPTWRSLPGRWTKPRSKSSSSTLRTRPGPNQATPPR